MSENEIDFIRFNLAVGSKLPSLWQVLPFKLNGFIDNTDNDSHTTITEACNSETISVTLRQVKSLTLLSKIRFFSGNVHNFITTSGHAQTRKKRTAFLSDITDTQLCTLNGRISNKHAKILYEIGYFTIRWFLHNPRLKHAKRF